MKILLKILNIFFVILGIIFTILLVGLAGFLMAGGGSIENIANVATGNASNGADKNPLLSAEQEAALGALGVDVENLPSNITPEMMTCFENTLGAARVAEIKAGGQPTATDYFKAQGCM